MGWILILLQIIAAIPTIIKVVKEIIDLIRQLRPHQQREVKDELMSIMDAVRQSPLSGEQATRLEGLRDRLRQMVAANQS